MRAYELSVTEMAGKVHQDIRKYLISRGYQYVGSGIDKHVFREPSTGSIYIVFGSRSGYGKKFTPDQLMFRDWIQYCRSNQSNPHLPKFSGLESFEFRGKRYLQARMEPLKEINTKERHLLGYLEDVVRPDVNPPANMLQAIKRLTTRGFYDEDEDEIIMYQIRQIIQYLGGPKNALNLMKTVQDVMKFGNQHGFRIDLHQGNYMQRPDGTIVVNDPYVIYLTGDMTDSIGTIPY
jgi:hypothetical protein